MKFCHLLQTAAAQVPEYQDLHQFYKQLKKQIKKLPAQQQPQRVDGSEPIAPRADGASASNAQQQLQFRDAEAGFTQVLVHHINLLNSFRQERQEASVRKLAQLQQQANDAESSEEKLTVHKRFVDFHGETLLLMHWSVLAYTAVVKVLKKHHKRTGVLVQAPHLRDILSQPSWSSEVMTGIINRAEADINRLQMDIFVRSAREAAPEPQQQAPLDQQDTAAGIVGHRANSLNSLTSLSTSPHSNNLMWLDQLASLENSEEEESEEDSNDDEMDPGSGAGDAGGAGSGADDMSISSGVQGAGSEGRVSIICSSHSSSSAHARAQAQALGLAQQQAAAVLLQPPGPAATTAAQPMLLPQQQDAGPHFQNQQNQVQQLPAQQTPAQQQQHLGLRAPGQGQGAADQGGPQLPYHQNHHGATSRSPSLHEGAGTGTMAGPSSSVGPRLHTHARFQQPMDLEPGLRILDPGQANARDLDPAGRAAAAAATASHSGGAASRAAGSGAGSGSRARSGSGSGSAGAASGAQSSGGAPPAMRTGSPPSLLQQMQLALRTWEILQSSASTPSTVLPAGAPVGHPPGLP